MASCRICGYSLNGLPPGPSGVPACPECGSEGIADRPFRAVGPLPPLHPLSLALVMCGPVALYLAFAWGLLLARPPAAVDFLFGLVYLPIPFGFMLALIWPPLFAAADRRVRRTPSRRGPTVAAIGANLLMLMAFGYPWVVAVVEACANC